jgi:GntR family transcriptional regulator
MTCLRIDPARPASPSVQLLEGLLDEIARGEIDAGGQLPTVRGLAEQVVLNPNTVAKVYRDLEALGVVEGRHGSGVFVTPEGRDIAQRARRAAVGEDVRRAVASARASGLTVAEVRELVEAALAGADRARGATRKGGRG